MKRSDGCDWLDLQVDQTAQIVWVLLLYGAVHRMTWRNGIKSWIISMVEMSRDIFGIFQIVFF